ncbi:MAG: class I SAM-dependent methyltransferase [Pseudomonadota bacterium]
MPDEAFWTLHDGLPRQGPGDRASTLRALALMAELPSAPAILDIGCGPGMQTLDLARAARDAAITAVDIHLEFLAELERRAEAAGLAARIVTRRASMTALPFAEASFDAVWCEGAIYLMGLGEGLTAWKPLLKPRGYVALTEPCWLKPAEEVPGAVRRLWAPYPAMTSITETAAIIARGGYREIGRFVLPESAWWDGYYTPLEARLGSLRAAHGHDPVPSARIDEARAEIDAYREYADVYGYVFFVMRREAE